MQPLGQVRTNARVIAGGGGRSSGTFSQIFPHFRRHW